jgi:hypothetical protein
MQRGEERVAETGDRGVGLIALNRIGFARIREYQNFKLEVW